jgi:TolB-like protein
LRESGAKTFFLDAEQGINTAIRKIRLAIRDDPEQPRYLQTVVGKGYRFVGPITVITTNGSGEMRTPQELGLPFLEPVNPLSTSPPRRYGLRIALVAGAVLSILAFLTLRTNVFGPRNRRLNRTLPIHSIAVLPLQNLSGDAQQEYFADGMTDELIAELAKISALRVISRTSVMQYKGVKKPLPQAAQELGVDAVVEGTVLRSGDRVRVTANLIQASPETHLWAESYERDLRDILALQSDVATAIAREIQIKVSPQEQARLASSRPVNPEAYQLYLKGRGDLNGSTQHPSQTRLALKTNAKSLARVRSAGTLPWLGFDRGQPNRSLLPGKHCRINALDGVASTG